METLTCSKCHKSKPTIEFSPDRRIPRGFQACCRACYRILGNKRYRANSKEISARQSAKDRERRKNKDAAFLASRKATEGKYYQNNKQAKAERNKLWKRNNSHRLNDSYKRYRQRHPQKIKAYNKAYGETHKALKKSLSSAWAKANPDRTRANGARRRARQRQAPINDFTAKQWREMKDHYGYRCLYCGKKQQRLTMDHITPLIDGGSHTLSNIVPACHSCNSRKGRGEPLKPIQPMLL